MESLCVCIEFRFHICDLSTRFQEINGFIFVT